MHSINFFNEHQLAVIPVLPCSKQPQLKEWTKHHFSQNCLSEFSSNSNYGVVLGKPSNGIVDIDLDDDLARKLAPFFLPTTGWVFGRESSPRSHWIYRVDGDAGHGQKFELVGVFAEYRSNGQMTVFPPSTHASGEQIAFHKCEEIGAATRHALLNSLAWMTAAAIIIPLYGVGKRNEIVLALSGMLLKYGKSEEEIALLLNAICQLTSDDEIESRLAALHSTASRCENDEPFTQESRLNELLGSHAVAAIKAKLHFSGAQERPRPSSGKLLSLDDLNDSGVSELFAERVKDRILFDVDSDVFAIYQDGIWFRDSKGLQISAEFDAVICREIEGLSTIKNSPELFLTQAKFLRHYRNRGKAQAALLQSRSELRTTPGQLDAHRDLIAVRNGVIDLRTGVLHPHSQAYYLTTRLNLDFDPSADCPLFKQVLSDAFGGNAELITYFKGLMGYWLTGFTDRQELYFLYGTGANGKSTILNAVMSVLGPYGGTMMSETIFESTSNQHGYDLASVRSCRLTVIQEAESKSQIHASRIKQLTGQDTVKVRQLYKDPICFNPQFKMVVVCNKKPNIDAYDAALKRRLKLIPFENTVPPEKRDHQLGYKLTQEAAGILNFMIEGAASYFSQSIVEPDAVLMASKNYFAENDTVGAFLEANTIRCVGLSVGKGALYRTYERYCSEEAVAALNKGDFGRILKDLGFEEGRSGGQRKWKGLMILPSEDNSLPLGAASDEPVEPVLPRVEGCRQ